MKAWLAGILALSVSGCSGTWVYEQGLAYDTYADELAVAGHAHAIIKAAEDGKPADWRSPKGGTGRAVPIAEAYTDAGGRTCRLLRQDVTRGSTAVTREAEACRLKDGSWVVIDRPAES